MRNRADVIVIGAGIVGLAHAYAAAKRRLKVVVFERNASAVGASIRNFGLIWPIGQQPGPRLERALRSRSMWLDLAQKAGFWVEKTGSLHLAYQPDEQAVLEEFMQLYKGEGGYDCKLLSRQEVFEESEFARPQGLLGGLCSATELTVDPREAIQKISAYLEKEMQVEFRWDTAVTEIAMPYLHSAKGERWQAERVVVCSGADFEHLYPAFYQKIRITKCKLQMMRSKPYHNLQLGPTLCGGLTLRHYDAFRKCPSLALLDARYNASHPEYQQWGIHVMITQNGNGELVIGDSHEYGLNPKPFDSARINQLILEYLKTFVSLPKLEIAETWHGIYPKIVGESEVVQEVEPGVLIVNALSGAGMTLSFGLAEENFEQYVMAGA